MDENSQNFEQMGDAPAGGVQEPAAQEPAAPIAGDPVTEQPEAVVEAVDTQHTHESVCHGFFGELEGIVHMGKSEIIAIFDKWKSVFHSL